MNFLQKLLGWFLGLFGRPALPVLTTNPVVLEISSNIPTPARSVPGAVVPSDEPPQAAPEPRSAVINELLSLASSYVGVIEVGGDNKGPEVERFQKAADGKAAGEPWCAAFIQFCVIETERRTQQASGLVVSEHVRTLWNNSTALTGHKARRVQDPQPGDLIVWGEVGTTNGHIGIVEKVLGPTLLQTIEGNTTPDMQFIPNPQFVNGIVNRNGNGVYRKKRTVQGGQKLKVLGFIRLWNQ